MTLTLSKELTFTLKHQVSVLIFLLADAVKLLI